MRELPSNLDTVGEFVEKLMVPGNKLIASYLESRMPPERAGEISSLISVRALIGMVVIVFVTQEILGAGRFLPVAERDITKTIAELFLRGVAPTIHDP